MQSQLFQAWESRLTESRNIIGLITSIITSAVKIVGDLHIAVAFDMEVEAFDEIGI